MAGVVLWYLCVTCVLAGCPGPLSVTCVLTGCSGPLSVTCVLTGCSGPAMLRVRVGAIMSMPLRLRLAVSFICFTSCKYQRIILYVKSFFRKLIEKKLFNYCFQANFSVLVSQILY